MHIIETAIKAHLADDKSTIASVGALYGMAIAGIRPGMNDDAWPRIHEAIRVRFGWDNSIKGMEKLDKIKQLGWKLYEATAAAAKQSQ